MGAFCTAPSYPKIWHRTFLSVSRPSLPSLALWPTFRAHRPRLHTPIIAASDQSGAELPLPCPDCPSLPSLALWPTFRGHRPRLHTPIIAVSDQSSAKFPPNWRKRPRLCSKIWRKTSSSVARPSLPWLDFYGLCKRLDIIFLINCVISHPVVVLSLQTKDKNVIYLYQMY